MATLSLEPGKSDILDLTPPRILRKSRKSSQEDLYGSLGKCPICDSMVTSTVNTAKIGKQYIHQGCIPAATLQMLAQISGQLTTLHKSIKESNSKVIETIEDESENLVQAFTSCLDTIINKE